MAERLFGLRYKLAGDTDNNHVEAVFQHLFRSQALNQYDPGGDLDEQGDPLTANQARLKQVAYEMLGFAAQHFAFVLDSFYRQDYVRINDAAPAAEPAQPAYPQNAPFNNIGEITRIPAGFPQFALRRVLSQISSDVLTLHTVWSQHARGESATVQDGLANSNLLATYAWQRFKNHLPGTENPLVYVRSNAGVRLMPYSSIPLISIPPSALVLKEDAMAIPHEFGHFLYWRGQADAGSTEPLQQKLAVALDAARKADNLKTSVCLQWREEIFADVIATLIGGPAAVYSLMAMLQEKVGNLFVKDDGHYPIPAVRPYGAIEVLKRAGWSGVAQNLHDDWCAILQKWLPSASPDDHPLKLRNDAPPPEIEEVPLSHLREDVTFIANRVLDLFYTGTPLPAETTVTWQADGNIILDTLARVKSELESHPLAPPLAPTQGVKWSEVVLKTFAPKIEPPDLPALEFETWTVAILESAAQPADATADDGVAQPIPLPKEAWLNILYLGGWGDAGPTGGSPHVTGE
jgi:hypothetical protein